MKTTHSTFHAGRGAVLLATFAALYLAAAQSAAAGTTAGGKIAFGSSRDGNDEIYVMNADGTSQVRLTRNPASDAFAAQSPAGTKIAFGSDRDGNYEIYVMNADGSDQTRLTDDPAFDFWPTWSPDGMKIAFGSVRDDGSSIYVMNADGSNLTRIGAGSLPAWSFDGTKIAFVGTDGLFVMNPDGSGASQIPNTTGLDTAPAWSPDGTKIAFQRYDDVDFDDVFVINLDGTGLTNVSRTPRFGDSSPSFSPDGTKVVFFSFRDGNTNIYTANLDGTGQTRLTTTPQSDNQPDWRASLGVELTWQAPADASGAPTNLAARIDGFGSAASAVDAERAGGPQVAAYNVYVSSQPDVPADPSHFLLAVPGTQTSASLPLVPGGASYAVTAVYDAGDGPASNEASAGTPGATISKTSVKPVKIAATGRGFTSAVTVFVDGIACSSAAKVNRPTTKVVQKGSLSTGATFGTYFADGRGAQITFVNSDQTITTVAYAQR